MRKQYDDFTQLKIKDMCKSITDMTYKYLDPETHKPTRVPPSHYENLLNQVTEKYMSDVTSKQFLVIMYNQLTSLKKEDEKYFNQALLCMDLGLNPKDLRLDERIAIDFTNEFMDNKKSEEKKNYHFLDQEIVNTFYKSKDDPELQSAVINESNKYENMDRPRFNDREYR